VRIALRSRVAQRILVETCRAARLEMGTPEDRVPHQDPPHEAQVPAWLHTLAARCPQLPGAFWARIRRTKVLEWKRAFAGFGYARLNLVEMPRAAAVARDHRRIFSENPLEPILAGFCSGKRGVRNHTISDRYL